MEENEELLISIEIVKTSENKYKAKTETGNDHAEIARALFGFMESDNEIPKALRLICAVLRSKDK